MRIKYFALFAVAVIIGIAGAAFGRDVTFFVASDLHYGQEQEKNNEKGNKKAIALMNNLPGAAFPSPGFGKVQKPRGVLVTGDLADSGSDVNYVGKHLGTNVFDGFVVDYPVKGGTGSHIHYPVFEGYGNHDVQNQAGDPPVLKLIATRNAKRGTPVNVSDNGLHYSWDWDDVHFVNLNLYAGGAGDARASLDFFQSDLAERVGDRGKLVVIMQHYGLDKLSTQDLWWKQAERDAFYDAIKKYKVIAIFTGHDHNCHRILWNGIPDFGAPKARGDHGIDGILAVRLLDKKMIVALRRLDGTWDGFQTEDLPAPSH